MGWPKWSVMAEFSLSLTVFARCLLIDELMSPDCADSVLNQRLVCTIINRPITCEPNDWISLTRYEGGIQISILLFTN